MFITTAHHRTVPGRARRRQCSVASLLPHVAGVAALLALLSGCTSDSTGGAPEVQSVDAATAAKLAFQYREEARKLSQFADGLEAEAHAMARTDPTSPDLPRQLSRIRYLRAQAEADFERAQEYRRQVPHNQVY